MKKTIYLSGATSELARARAALRHFKDAGVDVYGASWVEAVARHGSQAAGLPEWERIEASRQIRQSLSTVAGVLFLVPQLANATRGGFFEAGFFEGACPDAVMVAALPEDAPHTEFILAGGPWEQVRGDEAAVQRLLARLASASASAQLALAL